MIVYNKDWWGLPLLCRLYGSAMTRTLPFAIISMLGTIWIQLDPNQDYFPGWRHPYPYTLFAFIVGFAVVFRTNFAITRYWEGRTQIQVMSSSLAACAMQLLSWDNVQSAGYRRYHHRGEEKAEDNNDHNNDDDSNDVEEAAASREVAWFRQSLVHLLSLAHALALQNVRADRAMSNLVPFYLRRPRDEKHKHASVKTGTANDDFFLAQMRADILHPPTPRATSYPTDADENVDDGLEGIVEDEEEDEGSGGGGGGDYNNDNNIYEDGVEAALVAHAVAQQRRDDPELGLPTKPKPEETEREHDVGNSNNNVDEEDRGDRAVVFSTVALRGSTGVLPSSPSEPALSDGVLTPSSSSRRMTASSDGDIVKRTTTTTTTTEAEVGDDEMAGLPMLPNHSTTTTAADVGGGASSSSASTSYTPPRNRIHHRQTKKTSLQQKPQEEKHVQAQSNIGGSKHSVHLHERPEHVKSRVRGWWRGMFKLPCNIEAVTRYNAAFPLPVIAGLSSRERMLLKTVRIERSHVVMTLIHNLIAERVESGGLVRAPAPILTRSYQSLERATEAYMMARKLSDTPFPFPHSQLITGLLVIHACLTPIMVAAFCADVVLAPFLTLVAVWAYWTLNEVARELEDPFIFDPNNLPLAKLQSEFNLRLLAISGTVSLLASSSYGWHDLLPGGTSSRDEAVVGTEYGNLEMALFGDGVPANRSSASAQATSGRRTAGRFTSRELTKLKMPSQSYRRSVDVSEIRHDIGDADSDAGEEKQSIESESPFGFLRRQSLRTQHFA
ncbi:bestrophin [Pseudoscourfieldia marina]